MTILVVPSRDLDRAMHLLGGSVIAFSRTKNWLVVHHAEIQELLYKLANEKIDARVDRKSPASAQPQ